jgi:hypothetical protein
MPTVLIVKGYRFFFFSLDRGEPLHIHVEKDDSYAKFWLRPVALARSRGFRDHELGEIRRIIETHQGLFEEKWHEHFDNEG